MNQQKADKILTALYAATVVFTLSSSISSGVTWSHWKDTLNQYCRTDYNYNRNCSCILYAEATETRFNGGNLSICAYVYFGPVPVTLICIGFAIFHGIRACFGQQEETTRNIRTKNEDGETIIMQIRTLDTKKNSRSFYIMGLVIFAILTLYMLVHFSIFTDGYLATCKQYRKVLVKELRISGTAMEVIQTRLGCNAIYDFMDYLAPLTSEFILDDFINTAGALLSGILTSFFAFAALGIATVVNFTLVRN